MKDKIIGIKNFVKNRTLYQWLWVLLAVWIIALILIKLFVPLHGHRTWYDAIFHRKVVKSQVVSAVPMTDDNQARTALLDFYQKYTATTDKIQRQALVDKNTSAVFVEEYKNSTTADPDPVTCSSETITSVQISSRILFNKDYTYRLAEYTLDNTENNIIATVFNSDGTYKIGNISCGQQLGD